MLPRQETLHNTSICKSDDWKIVFKMLVLIYSRLHFEETPMCMWLCISVTDNSKNLVDGFRFHQFNSMNQSFKNYSVLIFLLL